ncbi:nifR3 family TIM-barrel protein [Kineosphaera limosa]|uniref:Putative tRNA-dihydrouridine synthase n=1 Tax=Kineosphaera limosa NBRC 100340 TaxID=1184609 RepID=K6X8I8_9MICO|nr:tRNA dihydrouridine synthase DusB [Kineosphaera limosa]NYE02969.1 nifR3 family TIM-barrel protein [Kineosphaera limosa]GAB95139.1 putative tRNA-dihydrouridine synthase [Kineosphaera limosa NBRC 100340]
MTISTASPPTTAATAPAPPLRIGPHTIGTPVVLAPMAGITNRAFRRLCRQWGPDCLYVSEMITSRALVERSPETMRLIEHDAGESPRSIQLYGVDPATVRLAARLLVTEDRADHIDLNFGCPVPKVTRKGGGAALPWKTELFRGIVSAAVGEASARGIPVTVKMRIGIDEDHHTYLEAGRIAQQEGVAAVALHARTASQAYSGQADWSAIARLREVVTQVPVLGNGDIWSAADAVAMVRATGCDGVVVGRGCLGRPWLFADLTAAFAGSAHTTAPTLGEVARTLREHTEFLAEFYGDEGRACRDIRKHIAWYLKGFRAGSQIRHQLALVDDLAALDGLLANLDPDDPWPGDDAEGPRGRAGSPRRVALPEHWLDSRDLHPDQAAAVAHAELSVSGG